MTEKDYEKHLYWLLLRVLLRAKYRLMRFAEHYDLTFIQLYTLCLMKPGEPLPMNQISTILVCDASNVTGIIDRLLSQNYITRQENPKDRRVKMIALTPTGEQTRKKILVELPAQDPGLLASLNDQEQAQLRQLLLKALAATEPQHPM